MSRQFVALDESNPAVADVSVDAFLLDGRPMDADVSRALIDVGMTRHLDGATELAATLQDPGLRLLNSRLFTKAVELNLDELPFVLADLELTDDGAPGLAMEFEPRAISKMRRQTKEMHASRADKTRAEFIKALCDRAGVRFVCPSLRKKPTIKKVVKTKAQQREDREPGVKKGAKMVGKGGVPLNSAQRANAAIVMQTARELDASTLAILALLMACIVEAPNFDNPTGGDASSAGILQLLASWGSIPQRRDIPWVVRKFLKDGFYGKRDPSAKGAMDLAAKHPDWSPGEIAQETQGSAHPGRYDLERKGAMSVLQAFGGGESIGAIAAPEGEEYAVAYMFRTLPAEETSDLGPENYWACARRLADEVNWRLWEAADVVYYMTDDDILRSRVAHTIRPGAQGIHSVTGRVSTRRPEQEVTVQCDARRWQAPPGTVCELEGYGPEPTSSHTMTLSGRWIVASIDRPSLFAPDTTITLHRRQAAKAEPAHDVRSRAADPTADAVGSSGALAGAGPGSLGAAAEGSPKDIIDTVVLPLARRKGVQRTVAENDAANNRHGPTVRGTPSDHQGPPDKAWATDLPCFGATGDKLCAALAERFGFPGNGAGSYVRVTRDGYSYQLLWKVEGHYDHVHFGIQHRGPLPRRPSGGPAGPRRIAGSAGGPER